MRVTTFSLTENADGSWRTKASSVSGSIERVFESFKQARIYLNELIERYGE